MRRIEKVLSQEFSIQEKHAQNILSLFEEGATVPFIARYRKENTGGMQDKELRLFHERWQYLEELNKRRHSILNLLKENKECTDDLLAKIRLAETKSDLEDLYAPFKATRRSKASEAISQGLKPLAEFLWLGTLQDNRQTVEAYLKKNQISLSYSDAVSGAKEIINEAISQEADFLKKAREKLLFKGVLSSRLIRGKGELGEKYQDYFDYNELVKKVPPHRLLALFRGKKEGFLKLIVSLDEQYIDEVISSISINLFSLAQSQAQLSQLQKRLVKAAWEDKLLSKLEADVLVILKERAEESAIQVFADNLKDLLMAAPAGAHRVLGLDPGFRNGVKIAAVNEQGELVNYAVLYPHSSERQKAEADVLLLQLIKEHGITWLAIGNGTASRETMGWVEQVIANNDLKCRAVVVSEAGASVYSASEVAIEEFPNLDVTIRGAISIARRFQDPLAELVKVDPQSIGVGQYQHDVKPSQLANSLSGVVEDCVNAVGVDVNLASASLLSYVSGLSKRIAQNIVDYRREKGGITSRQELLKIKGIGTKCFEQCAGFLRVLNGSNVLDRSGVHPESYSLVEQFAATLKLPVTELLGNAQALMKLKVLSSQFAGIDSFTFDDTLRELSKPGRDPRPEFVYAQFDKGVQSIGDLREGMSLEGVVTNVAAFGAFVDIGVHQDGLVHISQLSDRFVKDPRDFVKVGQVIKVSVLEVDEKRKRISLKALGL